MASKQHGSSQSSETPCLYIYSLFIYATVPIVDLGYLCVYSALLCQPPRPGKTTHEWTALSKQQIQDKQRRW